MKFLLYVFRNLDVGRSVKNIFSTFNFNTTTFHHLAVEQKHPKCVQISSSKSNERRGLGEGCVTQ